MADWHTTVTPPALARLLATARLPEPATARRPAYRTLAGQIRLLVTEGRLPVGARLPAERELASALELSRTTVATAYETLRGDGYLHSRRGAGSWTSLPEGAPPPSDALHPVPPDEQGRILDLGVAALPAPQPWLGQAAARAVELLPHYAAGHGHYPTGVPVLREAVARRYTERGLPTTPDQILITTGAMGGLHLLQRVLVGRGDRVAVEAPSYAHTLQALRLTGARLVPVPYAVGTRPEPKGRAGAESDERQATKERRSVGAPPGRQAGGERRHRVGAPRRRAGEWQWDLEEWQRVLRGAAPKVAYVIPDFHNPTGALIDEEQRRRLLAAARAAGSIVLVDETTAELGWGVPESTPLPRPMAALDRSAQVVTVGSAGKLLWGGLRIGWVRAAPALVRRLATERVYSDVGTPVLDQLIAAELLGEPLQAIRAHQLDRLRATAHAFAAALAEQLPDWSFPLPPGGLSLWVSTGGLSGAALARAGEPAGVRIAAGNRFGSDGAFEHHIRIPLTVPAAAAPAAVGRLAAVAARAAAGGRLGPADEGQALAV
ncbi:aminotransferase-like domain-containing protein [Kitasatospora cathayae]|uniref:PLP-dependent aminotransferase family protein n=1 Tax=Kitasatospora cathayae TaxID=3004092 RepID=A0ABY7Q170_9ACTN|nr:PLP-dependent aminotransferase family protein [Kitasatospora sp. HUAS 3-15]WBP86390.1 PLP-dependent aminotransferase family protein [Kitasatospora sp. HUAS 3-15]